MRAARRARRGSGLHEPEHELVLRLRRIGLLAIARIGRSCAGTSPLCGEAESRRLDLAPDQHLLDPMQRPRLRDAGAGAAGVVGDDEERRRASARAKIAAFMRARSTPEAPRSW